MKDDSFNSLFNIMHSDLSKLYSEILFLLKAGLRLKSDNVSNVFKINILKKDSFLIDLFCLGLVSNQRIDLFSEDLIELTFYFREKENFSFSGSVIDLTSYLSKNKTLEYDEMYIKLVEESLIRTQLMELFSSNDQISFFASFLLSSLKSKILDVEGIVNNSESYSVRDNIDFIREYFLKTRNPFYLKNISLFENTNNIDYIILISSVYFLSFEINKEINDTNLNISDILTAIKINFDKKPKYLSLIIS